MISLHSCETTISYFHPFEAINYFDCWVTASLNHLARKIWILDRLVDSVARFALFKGVVISCILWLSWGKRRIFEEDKELLFIRTILAAVVAIGLGRMLQISLPHRIRPLHDESLGFVAPHGVTEEVLAGWSSFPSDHAVIFFALSMAIWFTSKWLGALAAFWTIFVILLPRVYIGVHYPTDVMFGSLIGVLVSVAVFKLPIARKIGEYVMVAQKRHVAIAYTLGFLFAYLCATLFDDVRAVGEIIWRQYLVDRI